MIQLIIKGVCYDCPYIDIQTQVLMGKYIARCEHEGVCEYLRKEEEKARYKDTTEDKKTP